MSYYVIRVNDISEDGKDWAADTAHDEWFEKMIKGAVSADLKSFSGRLNAKIARSNKSLEITGGVYVDLEFVCDRCLTSYEVHEQIPFRILLEPAPKDAPADDDDEDVNETLDFSFYRTEEIDIGDLVRQHITTAQPMHHICCEDCKGLCPKCGQNFNEGTCSCGQEAAHSPFAVLGELKKH